MQTMSDPKKSIKDWACDDRPREKMISKGKDALSNAELIAILIGSGSPEKSAVELAREILDDNRNNLAELSRRSIQELTRYRGMGEAKAVSIAAALEIGNRRYISDFFEMPSVSNSHDAFKLLRAHINDPSNETFLTIFLNQSNKVIKVDQANGTGGISKVTVDVRNLIKKALLNNATAIIIGHNHPSDSLKPSQEDIKLTNRIKNACELIDIKVLDHIIIGIESFYSFAEEGML